MFGIPLMFMCLTYTGDLLADAFISLYSKIVNFVYKQICQNIFRKFLPYNTRKSLSNSNVKSTFSYLSFLFLKLLFELNFIERTRRNTTCTHSRDVGCSCFVHRHGRIVIRTMGGLVCARWCLFLFYYIYNYWFR